MPTGEQVFRAWRDTMVLQGRPVFPAQRSWEGLEPLDRDLYDAMAQRLAAPAPVTEATEGQRLTVGNVPALEDWADTVMEHLPEQALDLASPETRAGFRYFLVRHGSVLVWDLCWAMEKAVGTTVGRVRALVSDPEYYKNRSVRRKRAKALEEAAAAEAEARRREQAQEAATLIHEGTLLLLPTARPSAGVQAELERLRADVAPDDPPS
jgi:hypothetical protein